MIRRPPRSTLFPSPPLSRSVIDTSSVPGRETAHQPLFTPEPASVVSGRPFLYDAYNTSSNGEASCAACHIFGDFDSLAWDLGDPSGTNATDNNPRRVDVPIIFSTPE